MGQSSYAQGGFSETTRTAAVIHGIENGTVSVEEFFTRNREETVEDGTEGCSNFAKKKRTHRGPRRPRERKADTNLLDGNEVHNQSANWRVSSALQSTSHHLDSYEQHESGIMELRHSSPIPDLQDPFLDHGQAGVGTSSAPYAWSPASDPSPTPDCKQGNIDLKTPSEAEHTQELERCLDIHGLLLNRVNALPVWEGSDPVFKAFHEYLGRCEKSLHALQLRSPSLDTTFSVLEFEANESLFEACTDSLALLAMRVLEIEIQIGDEGSDIEDAAVWKQELALPRVYAIVEERGLASQKDLALGGKSTEKAGGHARRSL